MNKILITGCSGFLAYYLIKILIEQDNNEIYGITEVPDFVSNEFHVFNVDIRERESVFKIIEEIKPDIIFHLAAITNVGFSWKNQKLTYEVNFIGSLNIIEAVEKYSHSARLVLMSSAELYGKNKGSVNENSEVFIQNPYSLSKYSMELLGDIFVSSKKLNIIKIRSFNFTGPGQDKKFVCSDFAYQIAQIEKGNKDPVIKVGNLSVQRDFSDVRDTARYLNIIANKGEKGKVFNLCSCNSYSIEEILEILLEFSVKKISIIVDKNKFRPSDTPVLSGDCSLLRDRFDLSPDFKIEETLLDLLNYWRKSGI